MSQDEVIERAAAYAKQSLQGEGTGHDWWHVYRVWKTAGRIAQEEGADLFVVQLAALLHDIADWKFRDGDESAGPQEARRWLEETGVDESVIGRVCEIIAGISFKGAGVETPMRTKEGMVVQDADRLDALGAIGIARAFAYGGHKGRPLYDPAIPPVQHNSFEEYKLGSGPTINHFYEKLFLLRDRMNTATARSIAEERHRYMEEFVRKFRMEWEM